MMKITNDLIRDLATNADTYARGREYFREGRVRKFLMSAREGEFVMRAQVSGSYFSRYEVVISLLAGGRPGEDTSCECPAFESYDGLCKHCVAVLLKALEETKGEIALLPSRPATGGALRRLLEEYAQAADGGAEEDVAGRVRIEPELTFRGFEGIAHLTFKVGASRMYVVRDAAQFLDALSAGGYVEYGKELAFTHAPDAFEERSRALARMLVERRVECDAYARFRVVGYLADKRAFALSPAALEEFFALYEGEKVSLGEKGEAELLRADPKARFSARITRRDVELTRASDVLAHSAGHMYLLEAGRLYQCSAQMTRALLPLIVAIERGKGRLALSGQDVDAFCADVLPVIRPYAEIDGESAFEGHAPEEVVPRAYVDLPERDTAVVRPVAAYGYDELDLFRDDSKSAGHTRDRRAEHAFIRALSGMFGAPSAGAYAVSGEEEIAGLLDTGLDKLRNLCDVRVSDRVKRLSYAPAKRPTVDVSLGSGILELNFDVGEFPKEELAAALDAYRERRKYYRLADGRFVRFDASAFGDMARLADGLQLTSKQVAEGRAVMPAFRAMYLDGLFKSEGRLGVRRDQAFKNLVGQIAEASEADYPSPEGLSGELRPYQEAGYRWLRALSDCSLCGILADDMGLGKTVQFIALLLADASGRPSLIACPASLILNWESEIQKFAPGMGVEVIAGSAAQRAAQIKSLAGQTVAVTSYDLLKRDQDAYEGKEFQYFAIDEAQYIKNRATQNAQAVKKIACRRRFALTGTPIENRLSELWSIFDFLMPGYLYSYNRFRERFETPITKNADADARRDLKRLVAPFLLRRLKKDVLKELPPKVTTVSSVALEGEQRKVYEAYAMQAAGELGELKETGGERSIRVLAMLTRLRQLCCDPALCLENYAGPSAKLDACMELLTEAVDGGHKVLLFSQFTSMLRLIAARLEREKIGYYTLTGDTPRDERLSMVNRFNSDETGVFLISLKAGGTGLNLTGADTVILYDPWWNIAAQDQATDRAHRIGQEKSVQVYKLIAKNTVEEKILKLQKLKGELADVIEGEGAALTDMSKEELLELFSAR